jgi:DNA-binding IclR family transcriptional regulator
MQRPTDLIQSVSRAFRVLEVIGACPDGLAPKVVAKRAELHLSTTYHLLRTLTYEGYLVRTAGGDYRLGLRIADRFRDLCSTLDGRPQAVEVLRHLAVSCGHSAYLGRFFDGQVAIAAVVEAPGSPHLEDLVPGFAEAAHATAIGKALLSTLPTDRRHDLLAEVGMPAWTARTTREVGALDHELATNPGSVFVEEGQFRDGVSCAAALVATGDPDEPWLTVAISASSPTFEQRRGPLLDALAAAAADLAAA